MFGSRSWWNQSRQARPWARRVGTLLMVGVMAAGVFVSLDAEARRMGGGRSFGRQSQMAPRQTPPPAQQAAPAQGQRGAMQSAAQPNRSRWMAPLAGLAAGLGIAALLSHFGLGGALASMMANFIVIALIAMVAIWLIRKLMNRRSGQTPAYAGKGSSGGLGGGLNGGMTNRVDSAGAQNSPGWTSAGSNYAGEAQRVFGGSDAATPPLAAVPAGFDADTLLRNAKVHFVRLQTAWDRGDMADIREFTTPEMYAEIKIDLDGRGAEPNHTDVVQLNAELLSVEEKGSECFASVRFHGLIRESEHTPTTLFEEMWNLTKPRGEGWLLAGIQQIDVH